MRVEEISLASSIGDCWAMLGSMVVKGVVCKKNVAHRRMTSKLEKPRLLILGGALGYQRVSNLLSSFDTLLQQLSLDNYPGAGFGSKSKYMFGKVTGDYAGTVTAFYMSSNGPAHNELDFEFLGNTSGEPYAVQTNVYVNGVGNREQRLNLWFDPTVDFHSYSILWNQRQLLRQTLLASAAAMARRDTGGMSQLCLSLASIRATSSCGCALSI